MKELKDIFVSYEIAVQLKEMGFEEPCIAVYSKGKLNIFDPNDSVQWVIFEGDFFAPTWEQVFKWFREKGNYCTIVPERLCTSYFFEVIIDEGGNDEIICKYSGFKTYQQAQEKLIYKLIEIYKNGKN